MKAKELKEKLSKIEDDEEIFIKAEITNRYGNKDILFISFSDIRTEDGKTYLALEQIIEEQSNEYIKCEDELEGAFSVYLKKDKIMEIWIEKVIGD